MKNKNNFNETRLAKRIVSIVSESIMNIGYSMFFVAFAIMIYHIAKENYSFKEPLSNFEQNIFMMMRYGAAFVLGGLISMISCARTIQKASEADGTAEKICDLCNKSVDKLQKITVGDENLHICSECAEKSISGDQNQ